jgi:hypothetical protein
VLARTSLRSWCTCTDVTIAVGVMVKHAGEELAGAEAELLVSQESPEEADAYEQLLGDAMQVEPFHFAHEDCVEEACASCSRPWIPDYPFSYTIPGHGVLRQLPRWGAGTWHDPQSAVGRPLGGDCQASA